MLRRAGLWLSLENAPLTIFCLLRLFLPAALRFGLFAPCFVVIIAVGRCTLRLLRRSYWCGHGGGLCRRGCGASARYLGTTGAGLREKEGGETVEQWQRAKTSKEGTSGLF